ncbi:hypothetical protein SAMN05421771_2386 [Granulicella pectinivorans]|uniref:HTH cro/C1-type domain-containing protein n=1 Tax=Granulicella pectinivorans TaxID=474950 RepID=A0A1I6MDH6_9BACT|nr:hypothetical protein [Granulicella pectinivorans]SFS13754.1 hypothetical protein SAMN05421771_2386 [Granulicella pectinivorans]
MGHREAAALLTQLQHLFGYSGSAMATRSRELGEAYALNPNFIANIRHKGVIPNLKHLRAISEIFQLTLGSTFALFGFDLDGLVLTELDLNTERTRLIEHTLFGPGKVSVPSHLGADLASGRTAFLSQLIERWHEVPIERIWGSQWRASRCLYGKLGIFDSDAAPEIPPGAYVQIVRPPEGSLYPLSPERIYFVQHPQGYTACHCGIENGTLVLYPRDPTFSNPRRWRLHSEAIVLGVVTAFAATLPTEGYRRSVPKKMPRRPPAALAPWDHRSLQGLFHANCQRFGLRRMDIDRCNAKLLSLHGIRVSGKYALSLHRAQRFPHTSSALAMSVIASLRLRDVFRSCGFTMDDRNKYPLSDLLGDRSGLMPLSTPPPIEAPEPQELWAAFLKDWREWPALLRRVSPSPAQRAHEVLRLNQTTHFRGLERLLRAGSILHIDPKSVPVGSLNRDATASDWARRLYVIEVGRASPALLCGYLLAEGRDVILTSHPAARSNESIKFRRAEIQILGQVTGILARVV